MFIRNETEICLDYLIFEMREVAKDLSANNTNNRKSMKV